LGMFLVGFITWNSSMSCLITCKFFLVCFIAWNLVIFQNMFLCMTFISKVPTLSNKTRKKQLLFATIF
jgi:hypothetical protein